MLSQEFLQKMKARLEDEQAAVENKIKELQAPEEALENPDEDDLGNDAQDDILSESLISVHKEILEKIEDALLRIKGGTYGVCLRCGASISEEALEAEPWAEHCSVCGRRR